jgi:hypothetical protein
VEVTVAYDSINEPVAISMDSPDWWLVAAATNLMPSGLIAVDRVGDDFKLLLGTRRRTP